MNTSADHPTTLSPSGAALWSQCQQRWWYRYIDRLPEPPPGEAAVLGTFVHHILELLLAEAAADRSLERARGLARVAWTQMEASQEWHALELSDSAALRFRKRAWATVEAYFSCEAPAAVRPIARELEVRTDVAGVPFHGFIDLVSEHPLDDDNEGPPPIEITDYKTGKPPQAGKPWSADQDAERLLQPQWYAAALAAQGHLRPVRARLLYFTAFHDGRRTGLVKRTREIACEVTDESLTVAGEELRRRWDQINAARVAGHVDPNPGPLCGWCPFVDMCDAGRAACVDRWNQRDQHTGARRLRADAPAVALLGLDEQVAQPA